MTDLSPAARTLWPNRWLATMAAPEAALIAAAALGATLVTGQHTASLYAAATLLAAAYLLGLYRLAMVTADQRRPPVTPRQAFVGDLGRCAGSVLARGAGITVLGAVAGLELPVAIALGAAATFAIGWFQLTRQRAIVMTFKD